MTTQYHMTISLRGMLRLSDRVLKHCLLDDNGRNLTPDECRTLALEKLAEGFDVLPMCDNHDERGYCKGHPVESGGAK